MSRYLVFAGADYYPSGGSRDLIGSFDCLSTAIAAIEDNNSGIDWAHVFDVELQAILIKWDITDHFLQVPDDKEEERLIGVASDRLKEALALEKKVLYLINSPCEHKSAEIAPSKHGVILRCKCCLKTITSAKTVSELAKKLPKESNEVCDKGAMKYIG